MKRCKIVRNVPYIFCCYVRICIWIVKDSIHLFASFYCKRTNEILSIVPSYLRDIIFSRNSVSSDSNFKLSEQTNRDNSDALYE